MGVSVKLVALVVLVPAVADAGHCHEVSQVVGYQRCSRFGGWSRSPSLWLEGGPVALRFDDIHATGGRFRDLMGFRGGYFGSETDIATFSDGPPVDASPRGGVTTGSSSGTVFQAKIVIGYRQMLGPASLGLELAGGFRGVAFEAMGAQQPTAEMDGLVEVHAHADWWVSEHWTVGAQVATDVLRTHDDTVALTLGVHLTPWDGLR